MEQKILMIHILTCIVYIMSDWRVILSTVVNILSCDPSINIILLCIVVSSVETEINISIVVGYSPGHCSLTYRVIGIYILHVIALLKFCIHWYNSSNHIMLTYTLIVNRYYVCIFVCIQFLTFTSTVISIILPVTIGWMVTGILESNEGTVREDIE